MKYIAQSNIHKFYILLLCLAPLALYHVFTSNFTNNRIFLKEGNRKFTDQNHYESKIKISNPRPKVRKMKLYEKDENTQSINQKQFEYKSQFKNINLNVSPNFKVVNKDERGDYIKSPNHKQHVSKHNNVDSNDQEIKMNERDEYERSRKKKKYYNIFFFETNSQNKYFYLRQLCAIESAAKNNPNARIYVYSLTAQMNQIFLDKYPNVLPKKLDIDEFVNGTIIANWYFNNKKKCFLDHLQ